MALREVQKAKSFVEGSLGHPAAVDAGRWLSKTLGSHAPITVPAAGRDPSDQTFIRVPAVQTVQRLAEGIGTVAFVNQGDPTLTFRIEINGRDEATLYRMRDGVMVTDSAFGMTPRAAMLFMAHLLVQNQPDLVASYLTFLDGLAANEEQAVLNDKLATCSDELVFAIQEGPIAPDDLHWFSGGKVEDGTMPEMTDPAALDLTPLLADPKALRAFLAGESGTYDILRDRVPGAANQALTPVAVGDDAFIGPEFAVLHRFMSNGYSTLSIGPTGTGKTFAWELAMKAIDPAFDADKYDYVINGAPGMEDVDFVGGYILRPDGTRYWKDGPLTRAMRDGKRLVVHELSRLRPEHTNILLGALDFGRIALTRYDGELVVSQPGFAVDASANIGREYTATEEIDPALMRRFPAKVYFGFLSSEQEQLLLRSRHPSLTPQDAETLVKIATDIRDAYEYGGGSVLNVDMYVSPASLLTAADFMCKLGMSVPDTVSYSFLHEVAKTRDKETKVMSVVESHCRGGLPKPKR